MLRETQGLVLRIIEFSETSRIYHLYTRDLGRISVLAKGAKRTRSFLSCAVDVLLHLKLKLWVPKGDAMPAFRGGEVLDGYLGLRRDTARLNAAYYVAEFLRVLTDAQGDPPLFRAAVQALRALDRGAEPDAALAPFMARALQLLGLSPEMGGCVSCGACRPPGKSGRMVFQEGGLLCTSCRVAAEVRPEGLGHVEAVDGPVLDLAGGLARGRVAVDTVGGRVQQDAARLLALYACHVSGTEFRTLRFVWPGLLEQAIQRRVVRRGGGSS